MQSIAETAGRLLLVTDFRSRLLLVRASVVAERFFSCHVWASRHHSSAWFVLAELSGSKHQLFFLSRMRVSYQLVTSARAKWRAPGLVILGPHRDQWTRGPEDPNRFDRAPTYQHGVGTIPIS